MAGNCSARLSWDFGRIRPPGTPLDRRGHPRTLISTKNQTRRTILRPFRGDEKLPPDCLQAPRRWACFFVVGCFKGHLKQGLPPPRAPRSLAMPSSRPHFGTQLFGGGLQQVKDEMENDHEAALESVAGADFVCVQHHFFVPDPFTWVPGPSSAGNLPNN